MSARPRPVLLLLLAAGLGCGCVVEQPGICDTMARSAGTMVIVVDASTKTPICDATVRIVQGNPVSALTPIAGKDGAPCGYTGATFRGGDQGKSISVHVTRAGYQDALVVATVEGDCHPETFSPTVPLSK